MSTLTLSQSFSMTPTQKKMAFLAVFAIVALALMFIPQSAWAAGTDLFSTGKEQIKASTNKDSTLWLSMTIVGLAVAAITGFVTKNWFAAIGGFFAGIIFLNVASSIIHLN